MSIEKKKQIKKAAFNGLDCGIRNIHKNNYHNMSGEHRSWLIGFKHGRKIIKELIIIIKE